MAYKNEIDNALAEIDECILHYRRGIFSLTDLSQAIWDVIMDQKLAIMRDIIPLCAEYLIVDSFALSQFKNEIQEWKDNWRIGIYSLMQEIERKPSLSTAEKVDYYRAYIVLDNYPEYGNEN